eukprot:1113018-Rhodomonas_salina.3
MARLKGGGSSWEPVVLMRGGGCFTETTTLGMGGAGFREGLYLDEENCDGCADQKGSTGVIVRRMSVPEIT